MINRVLNVLLRTKNGMLVVFGILLLLLSGGIYLLLGTSAKEALVEQMLHREQLSARAGSDSLEAFFDLFGRSLSGLASSNEVGDFSAQSQERIDGFMERWTDTPVAGVVLIDTSGNVKFNSNRNGTHDVGGYLGDRDYFEWSKTAKTGQIFISSPVVSRLGASQGKYIVTVSTPVLDANGDYKGVLSASVILEELSAQYITPLKITDTSYEYLLNEKGDVLVSDQEGIGGLNFFDQMAKIPFMGSAILTGRLKDALLSRQEGKLRAAYPVDLHTYILVPMLVAYSPVSVGDNHLMLAISTPENDTLAFLTPFYFRDLGVAGLAFFAFLIIAVRIAKVTGYEEGLEKEQREHGELPKET